ncbi:MAG: hypothetical protein RL202_449 [Actinomycetota bacterium]|jgi:hypothetical protein
MSITNVLKFTPIDNVKLLDARGPRFGALLTTVVLAAVLVTGSLPLLVWQLSVFALGAFIGPQASPYAWIYRTVVKPRLRGDVPTEDTRPPQFAQIVGFLFALTATVALIFDATVLFTVATGFALAAAFLNSVFNFCLGCEMYLLIARARGAVSRRKNHEDSYNLPNL